MPPQFTVTVTTGRSYVSLSHGMQNDVSRPPENASTIGLCDDEDAEVMALPSSSVVCSRPRSRRCWVELTVATKIVSSPDSVPTISGHAMRSSVTATRCAAPTCVMITSRFGPAVRISRTNSATTCSACALSTSVGFGKL